MANSVKTLIQNTLVNQEIKKYETELNRQTKYNAYYGWVLDEEHKKKKLLEKKKELDAILTVSEVCFDTCKQNFSFKNVGGDIVIFYGPDGKLDKNIDFWFAKFFTENPDCDICYADEDIWAEYPTTEKLDADRKRLAPWSKPCWSPDTILSFQYFGNIFAVRREKAALVSWLGDEDEKLNLYDMILKVSNAGKVGKLDLFLFHKIMTGESAKEIEDKVFYQDTFWGTEEKYDDIKNAEIARRGFTGKMARKGAYSYPVYEIEGAPLVSIVIPSKDNVAVLETCLRSIRNLTSYKNYEIVVVDNGSNEDNRKKLEILSKDIDFKYHYEAMDFNFSYMCNLGVTNSKGEYIVLLNDDMEIIDGSWLETMLGQGMLPETGAVGAKLLYPNTTLIQHAGVTVSTEGPTHKLNKADDTKAYYFARNKLVYDMVGVTAACLLVKKEKFLKVEGLYEGLRVAFNDVDLCYKLKEAGLNNVQRNDVVLYHHESLSRGDDLMDKKKIERLLQERDVLYSRHHEFVKKDPYLGAMYIGGHPEIEVVYNYENVFYDDVKPKKGAPLPAEETMNKMVFPTIDECGKASKDDYYIITGWAYVPGLDNARFKKKLLLKSSKGEVYECPVNGFYRKDVEVGLPDDIHVALSGFCVHIEQGDLPADEYEIWMYAKDSCSRQCMYSNTKKILKVD